MNFTTTTIHGKFLTLLLLTCKKQYGSAFQSFKIIRIPKNNIEISLVLNLVYSRFIKNKKLIIRKIVSIYEIENTFL